MSLNPRKGGIPSSRSSSTFQLKARYAFASTKNWDEFVATGRVGRLAICHRSSFMDERTAMLRVCATLCRVAAAADMDFYRITGTLELFVLMRAQGYSARTFEAALRKYATWAIVSHAHMPYWRGVRS